MARRAGARPPELTGGSTGGVSPLVNILMTDLLETPLVALSVQVLRDQAGQRVAE